MKRMYQIGTVLVLFLAVVLAFQNCAQAPQGTAGSSVETFEKPTAEDIESRYDDIKTVASEELSCTSDADCVVVGVGGRNCGLPSEYVVTSKSNNLFGIEKLNEELTRMEVQYMAQNDMVSTCGADDPPAVACVANVCVAQ